jgi:hypothetical protein
VDEIVARSLAKWPNVPAVYGWLSLDRRGNWLIRASSASHAFGRIGNEALREFIGRNYEVDSGGRWYFQNGPQRVYVTLAYAPLVVRHDRPFVAGQAYVDDEGSLLIAGQGTVALLDDRDLARYADLAEGLPRVARAEVPARWGFEPEPKP